MVAKPFEPSKAGESLMTACAAGNADAVRHLLGSGASPHCRGALNRTPLHEAAAMGGIRELPLALQSMYLAVA